MANTGNADTMPTAIIRALLLFRAIRTTETRHAQALAQRRASRVGHTVGTNTVTTALVRASFHTFTISQLLLADRAVVASEAWAAEALATSAQSPAAAIIRAFFAFFAVITFVTGCAETEAITAFTVARAHFEFAINV